MGENTEASGLKQYQRHKDHSHLYVCVSVTMQRSLTCLLDSRGGVYWTVVSLGLAVGCEAARHGPTDY